MTQRRALKSFFLWAALTTSLSTLPGVAVADGTTASACQASVAETPSLQARRLDATRYEVTLQHAGRSSRFELRLDCDRVPLARLYEQAGFERRAAGWWFVAGAGSVRADERETATWSGIAATGFQGNVCRSVAGQVKGGDTTFFAEFCLPEKEYLRVSKDFDRFELHIVMPATR